MSESIKILSLQDRQRVHRDLIDFIEHRKSGLSLNHIIGCPLNCHYCVRLLWDNFDMKTPTMLTTDEEAFSALVSHPHFVAGVTPIQLFNRATDPFLPTVKPHLFKILRMLDDKKMGNLVVVITRYAITQEDIETLESLGSIKLTLFFTYSGGANRMVEPIDPQVTRSTILLAGRHTRRTRTVLYWRPLVVGWNDDENIMRDVLGLAGNVDAIVFSGFFYRDQIKGHFEKEGIPEPYSAAQRRKILPRVLETKVLRLHAEMNIPTPIFRKTTCAAAYLHGLPDPNGHWGVREICDICPAHQRAVCALAHKAPTEEHLRSILENFGYENAFEIADGHIWIEGLTEQQRYNLQHRLGFQVWDRRYPHLLNQHGRAAIGWSDDEYGG